MRAPFTITVYDRAFAFQGFVGAPTRVVTHPRHNAQPVATVTVPYGSRGAELLAADGARVVIGYDGAHHLGGVVSALDAQGPSVTGESTFTVLDDWRLLTRILGWPVPSSAIGSQSAWEYDTVTGPAETVVKALAAANFTRLGLPVTVATDLGRGAAITTSVRMHPLADRLLPAIDQAGIGVSVRQVTGGLLLDCYTPAVRPVTLTEASGIVQSWRYSKAAPTVTRVVVGAGGDGVARVFRTFVDAAREAVTGDVVEVFVDARDISPTDPDLEILVAARGQEALTAGAAKAGLSVELSETDHFRYGRAISVGDTVTLDVGVLITDTLREATLTWSTDDGLLVSPQIGDRTNDPDTALVAAVSSLARAVRNTNARS